MIDINYATYKCTSCRHKLRFSRVIIWRDTIKNTDELVDLYYCDNLYCAIRWTSLCFHPATGKRMLYDASITLQDDFGAL